MVAVLRVLEGLDHSFVSDKHESTAGLLVGLRDGGEIVVIGALHCGQRDLAATRDAAVALLPAPLAVVGCYGPRGASFLQQQTEPGGVAAGFTADGSVQYSLHQSGVLTGCTPEVLPSSGGGMLSLLAERYIPVRCTADLVLTVSSAAGSAGIQQGFKELEEQLCGPAAIYIAEAPAAAGGSAAGAAAGAAGAAAAAGDGPAAAGLQQAALPGAEPFTSLGASWSSAAVLRPYQRASPSSAGAGCTAPLLSWQPQPDGLRHSALYMDVLCHVPVNMAAAEAVRSLVQPAVRRQLAAMQRELQEAAAGAAAAGAGSLHPPLRALHFLPPGLAHHVTVLYPLPLPSIEAEEEALTPKRMALHRLLGLPANRPLLRVANSVDWSSSGGGSGGASGSGGSLAAALLAGGTGGRARLGDVHVGLPAPPVGGSVHLVQGSYDYYHYMQDKFDDCGWGCAYRSLQTICSWFARQHYASRPPPNHREIQKTLVSIGDKDQSFMGSKQWIGAIELGFVLDTLLGVQHKVLTVQSGDDMPSLAREIAHHFDTQGTPIMIGGGVLAYTLLGIDFDERTGRCAFLILDPHYTGGEDIKKIHAGQWVAWKQPGGQAAAGGNLFVASSFYNLLCPQRPSTV